MNANLPSAVWFSVVRSVIRLIRKCVKTVFRNYSFKRIAQNRKIRNAARLVVFELTRQSIRSTVNKSSHVCMADPGANTT